MFVRRFTQLLALTGAIAALSAAPAFAQVQKPAAKPAAKMAKPETKANMKLSKTVTARCGDSTWSSAAGQQGACASHGGVAKWFGKAPKGTTARCSDGEYWTSETAQGACSGHGGVAYWSKKPTKMARPDKDAKKP